MTQSLVPTPYDQQKPADSGFRLEIVCHIHGVIRDSYAHEVIDAHPEHTEEVHQEKVVNDGRYCDTHILKKKNQILSEISLIPILDPNGVKYFL